MTFYVRVYKPVYNKAYIDSSSTICNILNYDNYVVPWFSNMFFYICNKYSVKDAFFIYNDQRVFISKIGYDFFDKIINWDQFGLVYFQLWFIQKSFLSDRQYYYKSNTFQNQDIYFLPTNWLTTDTIFTENCGLTQSLNNQTARLFSLGKTIISYINEAIEPQAYSNLIPQRNASGTFKIRTDNTEFPGRVSNTNNRVTYNFYGLTPLFPDFPFYNQLILKMTDDSNVEPTMIYNQQVNTNATYFTYQGQGAVINPFASPVGTSTYRNPYNKNKTKGTFILVNCPTLKALRGVASVITHREANPKVDLILLARRPIIGNTVGVLCARTKLNDSALTPPIEYGLPKQILTYSDLNQGAINPSDGTVTTHPTARHVVILINDGTSCGNNYFQYPGTGTIPAEPAKPIVACITVAQFRIYYQNFINRPDFISHYPLVNNQTNIDSAKNNKEDVYPNFRPQYKFLAREAFSTNIKMPNLGAYEAKVILEWTNPDSRQVFDVPFSTPTFLKISPWSFTGDVASWSLGNYTSFNSATRIISPKMYDQSKFSDTKTIAQQFTPYFMNDCMIIQELPNCMEIRSMYITGTSEAQTNSQCLSVQTISLNRAPSNTIYENNYSEFDFAAQWDYHLKMANISLAPYKMGYSCNYNDTIVADSKPFQNGVRIFKNYIDRKLYYRFIHGVQFIIKIPYSLWGNTTPISSNYQYKITWNTQYTGINYPIPDTPSFTLQQFIDLKIVSFYLSPTNTFYSRIKNISILYVSDLDNDTNYAFRTFFVGGYVPTMNRTVAQFITIRYDKSLSIIEIFSPSAPSDYCRAYYNSILSSTARTKNDVNNITADFNPVLWQYDVLTTTNALWVNEFYINVDNDISRDYGFKSTTSFNINSPLPTNISRVGLLCLPQLNPKEILTSLVLASDIYETSRGQLLPSFIENTNSRNIINFYKINNIKSFRFYFNSINATRARKTDTSVDSDTNFVPDIYLLFK